MELLTERYADRLTGVLSCYDRMVITGTLPGVCFAEGMTSFLRSRGIRIFDYPQFALPLRERIRKSLGRVRKLGADYLVYAILDIIVDHYFVVLEKLGEKIEQLEEIVITNPGQNTVRAVHAIKREMIFVRKSVWPLREVVTSLQRSESALIRESNAAYFRDLHDHIMQVTDSVDTFRDLLNGMLDSYYSTITTRTNSVVKVLTLFSAIFMPLMFITGIFGMNFQHFPELEWHYGFQGSLILMVVVTIIMVGIFKWKNWL
jgi:magnesium transporter